MCSALYGQTDLISIDTKKEAKIVSLDLKSFKATKQLKNILIKLADNCHSAPYLANQKVFYYLLSKKDSGGYKIIIMPIINPTYEQFKNAFGILVVNQAIFYCVGDNPINLIEQKDEKYLKVDLEHAKFDENGFALPRVNLLSDLNTEYEFHSFNIHGIIYNIFIQPCR